MRRFNKLRLLSGVTIAAATIAIGLGSMTSGAMAASTTAFNNTAAYADGAQIDALFMATMRFESKQVLKVEDAMTDGLKMAMLRARMDGGAQMAPQIAPANSDVLQVTKAPVLEDARHSDGMFQTSYTFDDAAGTYRLKSLTVSFQDITKELLTVALATTPRADRFFDQGRTVAYSLQTASLIAAERATDAGLVSIAA